MYSFIEEETEVQEAWDLLGSHSFLEPWQLALEHSAPCEAGEIIKRKGPNHEIHLKPTKEKTEK